MLHRQASLCLSAKRVYSLELLAMLILGKVVSGNSDGNSGVLCIMTVVR